MPVEFRDYYSILGVSKNASPEEIKQAYRRLAKQHHPDVHAEKNKEQASSKFKEINEAYQVLSDPEKKIKYDNLGPDWQNAPEFRHGERPEDGVWREYRSAPEDISGFSDFFEELFGAAGRHGFGVGDATHKHSGQGEDIEAELPLTLEEAIHGGPKKFTLRMPSICPICAGNGRRGQRACPSCGGMGLLDKEKTITAQLPRFIVDGTKLRLRGQGAPTPGGEAGDLFLRIKLLPHPVYKVSGCDLETVATITPWVAALGGETLVPTLEGPIRIRIPMGTRTNRPLRIAGKGLTKEGGGRGDLYAVIRIDNPAHLTEKVQKLYREIKDASE